jgi:hypothetical protein
MNSTFFPQLLVCLVSGQNDLLLGILRSILAGENLEVDAFRMKCTCRFGGTAWIDFLNSLGDRKEQYLKIFEGKLEYSPGKASCCYPMGLVLDALVELYNQ